MNRSCKYVHEFQNNCRQTTEFEGLQIHTGASEFCGEADRIAHRTASQSHLPLRRRPGPTLWPTRTARTAARARTLRTRGLDGKHSAPLLRELRARLRVRVEHGEVAHNDGHRESDREYAGDGAHRTHEHSPVSPARAPEERKIRQVNVTLSVLH